MIHNINRNTGWQWVLVISLLCLLTMPARAVIPDNIDYQGYLTDDAGSPVNGTVSVTFSLYNVDTGGIALWSDTLSVNVTNGLFTVKLGGAGAPPAPPDLFDNPLWLGINVEGDGEMTPRIELSSVLYAFKADDALTLEGQSATSLDQSAHVTDTGNPHSVTAAQTGAVSSASFSLHTGDPSAHHSKTISFTELTDTASDAQLPDSITRDSELTTHASDASIHHIKTTSFTELTDTATDTQIPDTITINQAANADTLDNLDSTDFMSASTDNWVNVTGDTMTGNLNVMARIGIGTTTPSFGLDVQGGINGYLGRLLNDNNIGGGSAYSLYVEGNAFDTSTGTGLGAHFRGFGGSSSGNSYATQHYAYAFGTSTAYGVYSNAVGGSTTGREWAFYGIGDNYISGDVGIGTSNPGSKLAVAGGVTIGSAYNSSTLANGDIAIAGNVGIGTVTPAFALEIEGGIDNYLGYFTNDNDTSGGASASGILAMGDARGTDSGFARGAAFLAYGGNTSGTAYATQHYAYAYGSSTAYGVYSDATAGDTTGREFAFYGLGDGYFSGSVGIGTALPTGKFEVRGGTPAYLSRIHNDNNTSGHTYGILVEGDAYDTGTYAARGGTFVGIGGSTSGTAYGVHAVAEAYGTSTSYGVYSEADLGENTGPQYAFYGYGDSHVTGNVTKGGGAFKIDHPLDPENKYLYHSFVESPDMMNIYNGNIVLDANGSARVTLPDWFDALNKDFRYQLTPIGAPGPNLYIAQEITGNTFAIAGGQPGMKVSWMVTGIRRDAYANAHRIPVEEDKPANETGTYLHPEAFGLTRERSLARTQATEMGHEFKEIR